MVTGKLSEAESLLKDNISKLSRSDLQIYVNWRDLRVAKNLLKLVREYLQKEEDRIPASVVLEKEYQ